MEKKIDIDDLTLGQLKQIYKIFNDGNLNIEEKRPLLEWSETLLEGEAVSYEEAKAAVKKLGEGWRIPTRSELESILDLSRYEPAIDTGKFPNIKSSYYWSSTPCSWANDTAVWVVYFGSGNVSSSTRCLTACVLAVRSS